MESSSVASRLAAVLSAPTLWRRIYQSSRSGANNTNPITCATLYLPSSLRPHMWCRNINLLSISIPCANAWLSLGHDSPSDDCHRGGNLRLSAVTIFTSLAVTHPNILTSHRSSTPHGIPSQQMEALLYHAVIRRSPHPRFRYIA